MSQFEQQDRRALGRRLTGTMMLLGFGVAILAFLVSIDHPEWFRLRPVTNTAVAMAAASDDSIANAAQKP